MSNAQFPLFAKENKFYSVSSFLSDLIKLDHSKQRFSSTEYWWYQSYSVRFCVKKAFTVLRQRGAHCCLLVSVARLFFFFQKTKTFSQIMFLALPPLPKAMPIDNFEYCHSYTVLLCLISNFSCCTLLSYFFLVSPKLDFFASITSECLFFFWILHSSLFFRFGFHAFFLFLKDFFNHWFFFCTCQAKLIIFFLRRA